ncbi:MAG: hypothetical protein HC861_07745, partial [Rhodospirillaceae bacterium]|nr:hypothetical protein [Rhodospirillaceae bacterium]
MSVIAFRPIFAVTVEEKGTGKAIRALAFEPTSVTELQLADCRLVLRPRDDGFQLFGQFSPDAGNQPLGGIRIRTSFVFGFRLKEPDFLARYHPDLDLSTGPHIYLANREANGSMRAAGRLSLGDSVERADAARIVGRRLNARADLTANPTPTSLKVTDRFNPARLVASAPVGEPSGTVAATVAIDLSADPATTYTLAPQPADQPKCTLYVDDELAGSGFLGVLELMADPSAGPARRP